MSEHHFRASAGDLGILPSHGNDGSSPERQTIMVAVLGVVGVGKTSFINTVNGEERVPENSLEPSKPEIGTHHAFFDGLEIIFVDVPGFDNPIKPDILVLKDFLAYVRDKTVENIKLSGILYLHRITDVRMGGSAIKNMKLLRGICGETFLPRLTLVTTMWDIIQDTDGIRREKDLLQNFWEDLLRHKAEYARYDGTMGGARRVIDRYLGDPFPHTMTARIQQQACWPLGKTDVGRLELESIQQAEHQHTLRYEDLQRLQIEPLHSEMKYGELKEEQANIEKELHKEQRKIDDCKALLARYSVQNTKFGLGSRYKRTSEMADLEEAIEAERQAVESTPHDHPDRAARLNNLGNKLERRYERTGEMADLEKAIEAARQAVELTPHDHPDRAGRLDNLGVMLESRYKRTTEMTDLEEAIELARQAVESTSHDQPDRAVRLNNLGNKLESRYEWTAEMTDLEEAIELARQVVESTPHNHPDRTVWLNNLGNKLERRHERTNKTADLEEASSTFQDAWHHQTAIPFHRIKAAARCLKLLATQRKIHIAIQLGKDIIDLFPTVNIRLLSHSDQQFVVSTFAGVATDLCAFLLESNQPADALQYLEKGRTILIGQLVDTQSDLSSLAHRYPDIARRCEQLRDEVNTPLQRIKQDMVETQVLTQRREAVTELDACIQEIRGIAGHERFLLSQTTAEMQECAAGGTIVVVNIARLRSDAIIVSPAVIKRLNLPRLQASDVEGRLSKKWTGHGSERAQKNREYLDYLYWLWEVCVRRILDEVNIHNKANGLPRIWWIGTGLASSMPFHAAGIHSAGSTENAFSRAISSYTPSIKALGYARHQARATESARGSLLIATMPTTPGNGPNPDARKPSDLPGVIEEKNQLMRVADGHLPIEPLDQPSAEQVVDRLRNCCIAHFACHGSTDHSDPSNSGLILQRCEGGQAKQDRLTVQRVSELSLRNVRIAYLSACSTAENKAARLSDEVIHVVSGFQVAGFPHVIGCLWPSIDRACVDIASGFYSCLLGRGETGWDGREVASALREAVMAVRATDMSTPLAWAQFVHYGA